MSKATSAPAEGGVDNADVNSLEYRVDEIRRWHRNMLCMDNKRPCDCCTVLTQLDTLTADRDRLARENAALTASAVTVGKREQPVPHRDQFAVPWCTIACWARKIDGDGKDRCALQSMLPVSLDAVCSPQARLDAAELADLRERNERLSEMNMLLNAALSDARATNGEPTTPDTPPAPTATEGQ